jgi:acetolactate synthase-1/2/3 large subunit
VSPDAVAESARLLRSRRQTAIILGGMALRAPQLELASRIAAATGARLFAPVSNARIERGEGRYPVTRLPYSIDQAVKVLSDVSNVILVGAMRPVAFFAYAAFLQQSCPG